MKDKKKCIYKITNIVNNKIYIGSTIDFYTRMRNHLRLLRKNEHHSIKLQNSFNKHGESNFKFEIIETILDIKFLIECEQRWLDLEKPILNMTLTAGLNSHLGLKRSDETRNKISKSLTGKKQSKEHIESNRKSHIGLKQSSESKLKKSNTLKKYWSSISDEKIKSRGDKIKNSRLKNSGYNVSDEMKSKISKTLKDKNLQPTISLKVEKYDLFGNLIETYPSMLKAELKNNYPKRTLSYHLVKKNKNEYNGFIWKIIR